MTFHLSAISKRFGARIAVVAFGLTLLQTPGLAQVSNADGQYFYVQFAAGQQTANNKEPGFVSAKGPYYIDYVTIQCIGCTQAWHVQLCTRLGTGLGLPCPLPNNTTLNVFSGAVHSTGFMLLPTMLGGVNYGAVSGQASILVLNQAASTWEMHFSSGGVTTTVVPPGVYVEISGHMINTPL